MASLHLCETRGVSIAIKLDFPCFENLLTKSDSLLFALKNNLVSAQDSNREIEPKIATGITDEQAITIIDGLPIEDNDLETKLK